MRISDWSSDVCSSDLLLLAGLRCALQLALVGLVLNKLFEMDSPWWTGLAELAMVLFAGREIMARQQRGFQPLWAYGIGTSAMLLAETLVTILALTTAVSPDPWSEIGQASGRDRVVQ